MIFRRVPLLSLVLCATSACTSSPASERVTQDGQRIIGGTPDTKDRAAVLIVIQDSVNPLGSNSELCTGVVVSPHVVLTAGHCVDERWAGTGKDYFVFFGDDANDATQINDPKEIGKTAMRVAHPDLSGPMATAVPTKADFGVIMLTKAATVTPVPLRRDAITAGDVGKQVLGVGYGRETPDAGDGRRDSMTASISSFDEHLLVLDPGAHSMCEGDSGGPSILDGEVVGIASYGEHASCTGHNYSGRVDVYASWIDGYIRMADPGFLPEDDAGSDAGVDVPDAGNADAVGAGNGSHGGCTAGPSNAFGSSGLALLGLTLYGLLAARPVRRTRGSPSRPWRRASRRAPPPPRPSPRAARRCTRASCRSPRT
jgi:hypothetical protein